MQVQAVTKNFRMSAQKMREVVRQVQGLPAEEALAVLQHVPRKSARVVAKTLRSAIANAQPEGLKSEVGSDSTGAVGSEGAGAGDRACRAENGRRSDPAML